MTIEERGKQTQQINRSASRTARDPHRRPQRLYCACAPCFPEGDHATTGSKNSTIQPPTTDARRAEGTLTAWFPSRLAGDLGKEGFGSSAQSMGGPRGVLWPCLELQTCVLNGSICSGFSGPHSVCQCFCQVYSAAECRVCPRGSTRQRMWPLTRGRGSHPDAPYISPSLNLIFPPVTSPSADDNPNTCTRGISVRVRRMVDLLSSSTLSSKKSTSPSQVCLPRLFRPEGATRDGARGTSVAALSEEPLSACIFIGPLHNHHTHLPAFCTNRTNRQILSLQARFHHGIHPSPASPPPPSRKPCRAGDGLRIRRLSNSWLVISPTMR
jgi:hypothetical protein